MLYSGIFKIGIQILHLSVVFPRPETLLVVIMEIVGQTNQPSVTAASPPYLTIRSC